MYKAYIFDIDGTLLPQGDAAPPNKVQAAINALQAAGAIIIIATGRALYSARAVLGDIHPNYIISANGALVTDNKDKCIYEQRMNSSEMYALVDYADDYSLPLSFTFGDGYYIYADAHEFISGYGSVIECTGYMRDDSERKRHLIDMPYGACMCMSVAEREAFSSKYAHLALRLVPFGDNNYHDVFPSSVNKALCATRLAEYAHFKLKDTAAFGDGYNDIELLSECGNAVAVGTRCTELARIADITIAIDELADTLL